jgi:hypothetical protein
MRVETYDAKGKMIASRDEPDEAADPTAADLAKAIATVAQRTGMTKIEANALVKPALAIKP